MKLFKVEDCEYGMTSSGEYVFRHKPTGCEIPDEQVTTDILIGKLEEKVAKHVKMLLQGDVVDDKNSNVSNAVKDAIGRSERLCIPQAANAAVSTERAIKRLEEASKILKDGSNAKAILENCSKLKMIFGKAGTKALPDTEPTNSSSVVEFVGMSEFGVAPSKTGSKRVEEFGVAELGVVEIGPTAVEAPVKPSFDINCRNGISPTAVKISGKDFSDAFSFPDTYVQIYGRAKRERRTGKEDRRQDRAAAFLERLKRTIDELEPRANYCIKETSLPSVIMLARSEGFVLQVVSIGLNVVTISLTATERTLLVACAVELKVEM